MCSRAKVSERIEAAILPRILIMFLTTFFLIFPAAAEAQPGPKDLTESSLEDLANIQVYSASKHLQNENQAPSSVSVITADEIQKYGYRDRKSVV